MTVKKHSRKCALLSLLLLLACGDDAATDAAVDSAVSDAVQADTVQADSDLPASCEVNGELRLAECGMCGMQSEQCADGMWSPQSECLDQGECTAGSADSEDTMMCGRRQRLCGNQCMWGEWEFTVEEGECVPGTTLTNDPNGCGEGLAADSVCSDACELVPANPAECSDECGMRRTTGPLGEQVCIPAGQTTVFYSELVDGEFFYFPRTPTVSRFRIDRYPVTGARYRACVEAGDCTPPARTPIAPNLPQEVTSTQAVDFCASLGGQVPTLAQTWRAARGDCTHPANYPWQECRDGVVDQYWECLPLRLDEFPPMFMCGDSRCTRIVECESECDSGTNAYCRGVDQVPVSASVFGIEHMVSEGHREFIRDSRALAGLFPVLGPEYDGTDPDGDPPVGYAGSLLGPRLIDQRVGRPDSVGSFRCVWEGE